MAIVRFLLIAAEMVCANTAKYDTSAVVNGIRPKLAVPRWEIRNGVRNAATTKARIKLKSVVMMLSFNTLLFDGLA